MEEEGDDPAGAIHLVKHGEEVPSKFWIIEIENKHWIIQNGIPGNDFVTIQLRADSPKAQKSPI